MEVQMARVGESETCDRCESNATQWHEVKVSDGSAVRVWRFLCESCHDFYHKSGNQRGACARRSRKTLGDTANEMLQEVW